MMNIIVSEAYQIGNNLIVILPCETVTNPIFASLNHADINALRSSNNQPGQQLSTHSTASNLQVDFSSNTLPNVAGTNSSMIDGLHCNQSFQPILDLSHLDLMNAVSSNRSGNVLPEISNIPPGVNVDRSDRAGVIPQVVQPQAQSMSTLNMIPNAMAASNGVVSSTNSAQTAFMRSAADIGTLGRRLSDPWNSSSCNPPVGVHVGINNVRTVTDRVRSEGSDVNQVVNSDPNHSPLHLRSDTTTATTANTESTTSSAETGTSASITSNNDFGCPHCNKRFGRRSELREHLMEHSKGKKRYHCPYTEICSKSFSQRYKLNDHIRVHTGERPFECDFCHKTFRVKNNMKKHVRVHTGEKPYLCSVCYKRFTSKSGLNSHMKHSHNSRDLQRRKEMMGK